MVCGCWLEVAAGIVEILAHALRLARRRLAAQRHRVGVIQPVAECARPPSRIMRNASALRRFEEHRIVHQVERLQRRIGALAARARQAGRGRVEIHQLRIRHGALEMDVQPAAIAIRPGALLPLHRARIRKLGDPLGLRRLHAASADAQIEQPGRVERFVANQLRGQAQARLPRQQRVLRILRLQFGPRIRRLPVRRRTSPSAAPSASCSSRAA